MKKLTMTFLNESGKRSQLRPTVADQDLEAGAVKDVMDGITQLDLFEKTGEKMYVETKSAKYVETITTDLF
ncbi:MAG: DUF2922 domain-containing protein [Vagococcus sp.]|uniref:DUF2922 domain-containing protein n=1 Tax=Vagococcus sp. TaxID=1933889 RepID=UPI002FCB0E3E